jgi:hypothetical protein
MKNIILAFVIVASPCLAESVIQDGGGVLVGGCYAGPIGDTIKNHPKEAANIIAAVNAKIVAKTSAGEIEVARNILAKAQTCNVAVSAEVTDAIASKEAELKAASQEAEQQHAEILALIAGYADADQPTRDSIESVLDSKIDLIFDTDKALAKQYLDLVLAAKIYVRPALLDKVNAQ